MSGVHLLPAFGGLGIFLLGLGLSWSYLCGSPPGLTASPPLRARIQERM